MKGELLRSEWNIRTPTDVMNRCAKKKGITETELEPEGTC